MNKILLVLFLLSMLQESLLHAQNADSLFSVLSKQNDDTSKVNTLNALANEFKSSNPDTTIYFANEAMALATKLNNNAGRNDAHMYVGAGQ